MSHRSKSPTDDVLRAMAAAHPQPVHFGYLGLAFGISGGAMLRALRQLKQDGLICVDRSRACTDLPFAQARLTPKGMAAAAAANDVAQALRFESVAPAQPVPTRAIALIGRSPVPTSPRAEQLLGTAAA